MKNKHKDAFSYRQLLDRAWLFILIFEHVSDHPVARDDKKICSLTKRISSLLAKLYQECAKATVQGPPKEYIVSEISNNKKILINEI